MLECTQLNMAKMYKEKDPKEVVLQTLRQFFILFFQYLNERITVQLHNFSVSF